MNKSSVEQYRENGYALVPGLFSREEAETYSDHYMALRAAGSYPGDLSGADLESDDPLKQYPRLIHMHRWDKISFEWMIDPRMNQCLTTLLGKEPYAGQTMLYFKPPKSRGQALHQDQFYLNVLPGTCIAAWMALDVSNEETGCLQVIPKTGDLPVLCTEKANTKESFTEVTVPLAKGMKPNPVIMNPGDVFFFNGSVIHGSFPNRSSDRFRRALIGHYITGDAEKVFSFYHPVIRMDGTEVEFESSDKGSSCGVWVDEDGKPVVEMSNQN